MFRKIALIKLVLPVICSTLFWGLQAKANPRLNNPAMGQAIYEQEGANSCMFCHGIAGHAGKVAIAADLRKPKTWKAYKAIGGDAALAKNKDEFLKHFKESLTHLLLVGSSGHTSKSFERPWHDWSASGSYNGQMQGLKGTPSQKWMKRMQERGITSEIAADNVFLYIQKFDTQSVF